MSKNTAVSEFKVRDLMNAERPVSLYLVVPPSDKDRLKPLTRLIINQVVRTLTEKMEFKDGRSVASYKHRLLLLIDEFPSLGKLDIFEEALAFIAGYGMKAYLIIQDISQLWTAYGKDESIFSNCHVRVAYAPNKVETAELLSKMTGTATVVKEQTSYSGDRLQPMLGNVSTSQQEVARALLTPDEVMRLPAAKKDAKGNVTEAGDMLIFVAGHSPIYGKQILYFLDPTFSARAKLPAPAQSDRLIEPPPPAAKLDAPAEVPDPPQPPQPDIAASYAQADAAAVATSPQAAPVLAPEELSDDDLVPIEDAPDDIADPAPSDDDEAPPPDSTHSPGLMAELGHQADEPDELRRTGDADDLLNEMKAVSAEAEGDADFLGMFDDVIDVEEPARKPKPAAGGEHQDIDLNDGMAALLSEVANEPPHHGHIDR